MVNALEATADGEMTVVVLAPLSDEVLPPDAVDAPPPPVALVVAAAEEEAWDCVCVCVCVCVCACQCVCVCIMYV